MNRQVAKDAKGMAENSMRFYHRGTESLREKAELNRQVAEDAKGMAENSMRFYHRGTESLREKAELNRQVAKNAKIIQRSLIWAGIAKGMRRQRKQKAIGWRKGKLVYDGMKVVII